MRPLSARSARSVPRAVGVVSAATVVEATVAAVTAVVADRAVVGQVVVGRVALPGGGRSRRG